MFRIALTRYPRRSSQLPVAICPRHIILSLFRIGNTQAFSLAKKCDEHVEENQAPRRTDLKHFESGTLPPKISDPLSSCDSVEKVFYHLGKYPKVDIKQYEYVMRTIQELYRTGRTELSAEKICRAEEFETLIEDVGSNVRLLTFSDALTILRVLTSLGISSNGTTCQSLLRTISKGVNGFYLNRILFLDVVLRKCARSPIVDRLQSTVPVIFETQVRSQLDTLSDVSTLAHAVCFTLRCRSISVETRGLVVDAALAQLHQFNAKECSNMLKDFTLPIPEDDPKNMHDLHNALLTKPCENFDQLSPRDRIVALPEAIIQHYLYIDQTRFNQEIMEKAIQSAIQCDEFRAHETGLLLRSLNKISYYCPTLLDYVDKQLQQSADLQTFPRVLLYSYVISCADCSYKPRSWKKYEEKLVQFIEANIEGTVSWQIGNALLVLKCWSKTIVEYCLQDDRWRPDSEAARELRFQAAMMNLYLCVKLLYSNQYTGSYPSASNVERITKVLRANKEYPLLDSLKLGLGGLQYVLHGVNTKLGQFIDYLIVKRKNGELYPINTAASTDNSEILYESLSMPEDSFPIAIVLLNPYAYCLDGVRLRGRTRLQLRCLEVYGITPIPISYYKWLELPDYEKVLFLVDKIDACVPVSKSKRKLLKI